MNWIKQEKIYEHYALTKTYQSYLRAMVTGYDARKGELGKELEITLEEFSSFIVDEEKACYIEIVDLYYDCADRKSTRLNSSHVAISYAVFCLKKKNKKNKE